MLSENIKTLRKQKGYSQEQLADKLNVVRQTLSKWEKGYSVPDADMLEDLADIFEVQVGDLLGKEILTEEENTDISELVKQLTILNEYLSEKVRRRKKVLKITKTVLASLLIVVLTVVIGICAIEGVDAIKHNVLRNEETNVKLLCSLDGTEYTYDVSYSGSHLSSGGYGKSEELYDFLFSDRATETEKENSEKTYEEKANEIINKTRDYFISKGGTCEIIHEDEN